MSNNLLTQLYSIYSLEEKYRNIIIKKNTFFFICLSMENCWFWKVRNFFYIHQNKIIFNRYIKIMNCVISKCGHIHVANVFESLGLEIVSQSCIIARIAGSKFLNSLHLWITSHKINHFPIFQYYSDDPWLKNIICIL